MTQIKYQVIGVNWIQSYNWLLITLHANCSFATHKSSICLATTRYHFIPSKLVCPTNTSRTVHWHLACDIDIAFSRFHKFFHIHLDLIILEFSTITAIANVLHGTRMVASLEKLVTATLLGIEEYISCHGGILPCVGVVQTVGTTLLSIQEIIS